MSVCILIISHGEIGHALVKTLKTTFGRDQLPLPVSLMDVLENRSSDADMMICKLKQHAKEVDQGDGVLILTDVFGATPTNIAQEIQNEKIRIVTGLNLPMLLRIMNDAALNLEQLAHNAMESGQAGIVECGENKQQAT